MGGAPEPTAGYKTKAAVALLQFEDSTERKTERDSNYFEKEELCSFSPTGFASLPYKHDGIENQGLLHVH